MITKCFKKTQRAHRGYHNSLTGFTLLETVVAVSVMMVALVGPLELASQSIRAQGYTRNNLTAYMLAQEGIELFRWYRDNNILSHLSDPDPEPAWLFGTSACPADTNPEGCGIDAKNYVFASELPDCNSVNSCNLSFDDDSGTYFHCIAGCTPTIFRRSIHIYPISVNGKLNEVKVTVRISWSDQFGDRSFETSTHFFNWFAL